MEKKRKKKPPLNNAKKKRGRPKKIAVEIDVESPTPVKKIAGESPTLRSARFVAGLDFVTSLEGLRLKEMVKLPKYENVPYATLAVWAMRDNWKERRREFLAKLQQDIEDRVSDELVQSSLKDLEILKKIQEDAVHKLMNEFPEVKSYEGLMSSITRLIVVMGETREKITSKIAPASSEAAAAVPTPELTPEENTEMALALIRSRREKMRAENAKLREIKDSVPDPELKALPGNG